MLPRNAERVVAMRRAGNRPGDGVTVSFVGSVPWEGMTVFASPGQDYDWRFLVGLPVVIATKPGLDVAAALKAIWREAELYPTLVDVEHQRAASLIEPARLGGALRLWPHTSRGQQMRARELFS